MSESMGMETKYTNLCVSHYCTQKVIQAEESQQLDRQADSTSERQLASFLGHLSDMQWVSTQSSNTGRMEIIHRLSDTIFFPPRLI